jgi:pyridoxal phosphate enzyme (YggS family)
VSDITTRLASVRERIARAAKDAGRDAADITLVAVSKNVAPDLIVDAIGAGQHVFGENRAQELVAHASAVSDALGDAVTADVEWHFVGRLQRNKVRAIASTVALWQSVDRPELVTELAKHAPGARMLVQVDVGDEPQKGGCAPDGAAALVEQARNAGLRVEGLMTVPPMGVDPRRYFAALRTLADRLDLDRLSMGMSSDFEAAIGEGATIVRVGTAVFGPRPTSPNARR